MISTPLDKALKLVLEDIPKVIQVDCTAPLSNTQDSWEVGGSQ